MSFCEICETFLDDVLKPDFCERIPSKRARTNDNDVSPLPLKKQQQQNLCTLSAKLLSNPLVKSCSLMDTLVHQEDKQHECPVEGCQGTLQKNRELPLRHHRSGSAAERRGHDLYVCSAQTKEHQFSRCLSRTCSDKLLQWESMTLCKKRLSQRILNCLQCCYEKALVPDHNICNITKQTTSHTHCVGAKHTRLRCHMNASAGSDTEITLVFPVRVHHDSAKIYKDPEGRYLSRVFNSSTMPSSEKALPGSRIDFLINTSKVNSFKLECWKRREGRLVRISEEFYDVEWSRNITRKQAQKLIRTNHKFWSRHPKCVDDVVKLYARGCSDYCPGCHKQSTSKRLHIRV